MAGGKNWSVVRLVGLVAASTFTLGVNAGVRLTEGVVGDSSAGFVRGMLSACGEDPCVIGNNSGGKVADFEELVRVVRKRKIDVVIVGECASACAMFADLARDRVRITPTATFAFHRTNFETKPPASPDIMEWVESNGGFPSNASGKTTVMRYPDTLRYWSLRPMVMLKPGAVAITIRGN